MKKFFNVFFAAVLLLVSAESLYAADLKINGEYRVRGYSYSSVTGQDTGAGDGADYIDQRLLLTGTVSQGITTGVFELNVLNTNDGGTTNQGGNIWGTNGAYSTNITHGGVHQAYMNVTLPMANLMAGRRIIKLGHGIILNDTADNLALKFPFEMVSIDLAYLKLQEPDSVQNCSAGTLTCPTPPNPASNDLDRNGYLVNIGFKPVETWNAGLFYVSDSKKQVSADNITQNVAGLSVDGQAGPLGLAFEYDNISGNAGVNSNFKGQNLLAVVSGDVAVAKVGLAYLRVTGASAGSTDVSSNSIAGDFVGGHGILFNDQTRYGGGIDVNSRVVDANYGATPGLNNNFHAIKLFAETMPTPDSNLGVEIFPLVQLVDSAVAFGTGPGAPTDTNVGQEFNIYGGYKLDKNLSLTGVAAYFNSGDVIKDLAVANGGVGADKKNVIKLNAALTYTF
ncbi:MAG: hypothetical protein ACYDBV_06560 [Nitrospiria bacterium]